MPSVTLPPELEAFLRSQRYGLLTIAASIGTVLIAKAPAEDIESCRGRRTIVLTHELYAYPSGPVLRMLLSIDDESGPLVLETFCNVAASDQLSDWRSMLAADVVRVAFFDEGLRCRLMKAIPQAPSADRERLIPEALAILAGTDPSRLDFDAAKAAVMADHPI